MTKANRLTISHILVLAGALALALFAAFAFAPERADACDYYYGDCGYGSSYGSSYYPYQTYSYYPQNSGCGSSCYGNSYQYQQYPYQMYQYFQNPQPSRANEYQYQQYPYQMYVYYNKPASQQLSQYYRPNQQQYVPYNSYGYNSGCGSNCYGNNGYGSGYGSYGGGFMPTGGSNSSFAYSSSH